MERLIAARKAFEEALRREQEVAYEMLEADENEKVTLLELLREAKKNKIEAEANLKEVREAFLREAAPKRNERLVVRKWFDAEGNEHTIEYLLI